MQVRGTIFFALAQNLSMKIAILKIGFACFLVSNLINILVVVVMKARLFLTSV